MNLNDYTCPEAYGAWHDGAPLCRINDKHCCMDGSNPCLSYVDFIKELVEEELGGETRDKLPSPRHEPAPRGD